MKEEDFKMFIKSIELGDMKNLTYLVVDEGTRKTAVIDVGWEHEKIVSFCEKNKFLIDKILLTHTHFDHCQEAWKLSEKVKCKIFVNKNEMNIGNKENVVFVEDKERIEIGKTIIIAIRTPGHTPGGTCYVVDKNVFTGDVLFVGTIGRTDLPGGNDKQMKSSLKRIVNLGDDFMIFPGHDYGNEKSTSIEKERKTNPFLVNL